MGARAFMKIRLDEILPEGIEYGRVDRDWRASPGEGYAAAHRAEQTRIVRTALDAES
jgi:2-oxoglutarate decarboxylase